MDTTSEMLKDFYSNWGDVTDAVVMTDSQTKRSRGLAYFLLTYTIHTQPVLSIFINLMNFHYVPTKIWLPCFKLSYCNEE